MNSRSFIGLLFIFTGGGFIGYGIVRESGAHLYMLIAGFLLVGVGGYLFGSLFGKSQPLRKSPSIALPLLYAGFTFLGIYQFFKNSPQDAMSSLGIALAFDPFDPGVSWKQRPIWQKGWLILHLTVVLLLLAGLFTDATFMRDIKAGFNDGFGGK